MDGIGGEVGIAPGGLGLGMVQQLADHRQGEAAGGGVRCKDVAQVVDSNVVKACTFSIPPPVPLEICEMCAGLVPDNDIGAAGEAGDGFEQLYSLRAELDRPLARLGIVEPYFFRFEIDAAPFEFLDFTVTAAAATRHFLHGRPPPGFRPRSSLCTAVSFRCAEKRFGPPATAPPSSA